MKHGLSLVRVWAGLALLAGAGGFLAGCAGGPGALRGAGETKAARADVVAAVQRLFDAMRSKDEPAMRALLGDSLAITSVSAGGEPRTILGGPDAFIRSVLGSSDVFDERFAGAALARVDGQLAVVWAPYTFHRGGAFSHCGYDALHLARQPGSGQWRIVAIAYTRRFGADCDDIAPPASR